MISDAIRCQIVLESGKPWRASAPLDLLLDRGTLAHRDQAFLTSQLRYVFR